ncbi:MAG: DMT family transporter [Candidatus Woesearchaeota archaeon]|nr:DMT family transporter [Candidatus Woesearchaeota archaeon]
MELTVFFWILLTIIFASATRVMHRYIVKDTSPYAYTWLTQVIGTLLLLPVAITHFSIPSSSTEWLVLLGASILWVLVAISAFTAFKNAEVSLKEPISQSKLIWVLIFGGILLGETITTQKILGTLIIFLGVSVLIWHPE